jgi:PAS domain S-box-containing protein
VAAAGGSRGAAGALAGAAPSFRRRFRVRYVGALAVLGALAIVSHLVTAEMPGPRGSAPAEVSLALRQPLLVERVALLAERHASAQRRPDRARARALLAHALRRLRAGHRALAAGEPARGIPAARADPRLASAYFAGPHAAAPALARYLDAAEAFLAAGEGSSGGGSHTALRRAAGPLTGRLERIARLHEERAVARAERLAAADRALVLLKLAALVLAGLVVFRPMESSLARVADRLAEVFSVMRQGLLVVDREGLVEDATPRFRVLLECRPGWSPVGRPFADVVALFRERGDFGDALGADDPVAPLLAGTGDFGGLCHETPSGRTVAISVTPRGGGGHVVSYHDITRLRRQARSLAEAERQAAENEARARELSVVAERTHDMILIGDAAGRIRWVNRAFTDLTGHAAEEVTGRPLLMQTGPETALDAVERLAAALRGRRPVALEAHLHRRDGTSYWADITLSPVIGDAGTVTRYICVQRDGTHRRRMQERLEASERRARELASRAEAANRAKSAFLAGMSHEIRTPMNGIIGMAELLAETRLSAEQRLSVETIRQSADALLVLINDILDFSKIEAGRLTLEEAPFDIVALAEEVAALVAPRTRPGVEVVLDAAPDLPRAVRGDAARVRQILLNLAGNAVKFTERGHVLLLLRSARAGGGVAVTVRDTGIGIDAETLPHIFGEFVQADQTASRRFEGTGLGLAITRRLVSAMGGTIGVRSVPGRGSAFRLVLPLPPAAGSGGRGRAEGAGALAGQRILVADGLPALRGSLARLLAGHGAVAATAGSAVDAREALERAAAAGGPFDLVLAGARLPGGGAGALARAAAETAPGARILCLGAAEEAGAGTAGESFAARLATPVRPSQLPARLAALLGERPPARDAAPPASVADAAAQAAAPAGPDPCRVLVAEDNRTNREVIRRMLSGAGCAVEIAGDGRAAVEMWRRLAPDLVLMDVSMPEMDGLEATRRIRAAERAEDRARTPVVALTANAMAGDRERCLAAGMDGYLAKPVRKAALFEAVRRHAGEGPAARPPGAPERQTPR